MRIRPSEFVLNLECVLRTDDPHVCKFILKYKAKGKIRRMMRNLDLLGSQSKLLNVLVGANADLPNKIQDRKKLVTDLIEQGTGNVPEWRITKRSGLSNDGQFVLPDVTIADGKPDIFNESYFEKVDLDEHLNGSLDEWKELLKPVCEHSNLMNFAILAGLTGPLLPCFKPDIGIAFNFAGPTGTGKKTLMRIGQSVLRRARLRDIPTLNETFTRLEGLAYDNNDTVFCLHDIGTALKSDKMAKEMSALISYLLCGGVGRGRAKNAAANMGYPKLLWRSAFFTSSEAPISEIIGARFPNEEVGLVEISMPSESEGGIFDLVDPARLSKLGTIELENMAENAISQNYGHAFREFVRYLLEDGGDYAARARKIQRNFVRGMIKRGEAAEADTGLLDVFGKVAAAAMLAEKAGVLPFTREQARSAIVYAYSRTVKAKEHANALRRDAMQALFSLAADDAHCFQLRKGQKIPEHLKGKLKAITKHEKGRKLLCVLPDCFKALVGPMNAPSILAKLETAGVLIKTGQNKARQIKVEGLTQDSRPRLYCLDLANLQAMSG